MSLVWNWINRGANLLDNSRAGRFTAWFGRRMALRHGDRIVLPASTRVHPDALIHPREGLLRFGEHGQVSTGAIVQGNVQFGDHCSVQTGTIIVGYGTRENPTGQITIGNHVRIAPFAQIMGGNHDITDPEAPIGPVTGKPIVIGDNVWVCGRVIITAGVTVGRNAILAAGAVVTRDVPPFAMVAGAPAKVVRYRKSDGFAVYPGQQTSGRCPGLENRLPDSRHPGA